MFCYKCGCNNDDGYRFCTECGTELKMMHHPSAVQNSYADAPEQSAGESRSDGSAYYSSGAGYSANPYENGYYSQPSGNAYTQQTTINSPYVSYDSFDNYFNPVKRMFSNVLFLVGIIGYSAGVLINMILKISGQNSAIGKILSAYQRIASITGFDLEMIGISPYDLYRLPFFGASRGVSVLSAVFSAIPALIVVLGFWLIFASAKNKTSPNMTPGGFTILKVMVIIRAVLIVLGFAAGEILLLILAVTVKKYSDYGYVGSSAFGIVMILILLFICLFAVEFMYILKLIHTIGSVRDAGVTGKPAAYVSTFVGVVFFISFAGSIISFFGSILNPVGLLPIICNAVYQFCIGLFLFKLKGKVAQA